jgi:hypothetical protein
MKIIPSPVHASLWGTTKHGCDLNPALIAAALMIFCWLSVDGRAQSSSIFNPTPPDAGGWEVYDPLQVASLERIDGTCVLAAGPSPMPSVAPAMVGLERLDVAWADFEISLDLTGWRVGEGINSDFGILARASANPDGTRNGVMLGFMPDLTPALEGTGLLAYPTLGVDIIVNSRTAGSRGIVDLSTLMLDPAKWYRLVFRGHGSKLVGELYERADLQTPIARTEVNVSAEEAAASGGLSIVAVDRSAYAGIGNHGVEVTVDNLFANAGLAEPEMAITPAVILTWPVWTAGFLLEGAGSIDGPWTAVDAQPNLTSEGNVVSVKATSSTRYFRLVRL